MNCILCVFLLWVARFFFVCFSMFFCYELFFGVFYAAVNHVFGVFWVMNCVFCVCLCFFCCYGLCFLRCSMTCVCFMFYLLWVLFCFFVR